MFYREGSRCLICGGKHAFFTSKQSKKDYLWSCQNVCGALRFASGRCVFVEFGSRLSGQIIGIPKGTKCAHLVVSF